MKWYFTPSLGHYGAAIEIDDDGHAGRMAFASISPQGLSFVKWAPLEDKMCGPKGFINMNSLILYEALPDQVAKLNSMFSVIIPVNGKPRLLP